MDPYLVPYLVKISENVDPISGEQCNNYTKSYDLFDTQAQKIIPCKYSNAEYVDYSFTDSISLRVESEIGKVTKYAIIKSADDIANASWYDQIIIITPNILVAKQNQFYGIIDDNNSILVPFLYEDVSAYKCEDSIYLITKKNGKYGIIDEYGNDILPFDYKCISCNSKLGIFVLQLDNITIILNPRTQEETILYIQATDVIDISEGIALLKNKQSRYLLYDLENDKLLTNYSYSSASPMINGFSLCCGYILVYKDGRTFEFDKDANLCRSKSILYKANHIGDDVWQIIVYKEDKFVSSFKYKKSGFGIFTYGIYDDKYVKLGSYREKFDIESVGYYDLYGNELDDDVVRDAIRAIKENKKQVNVIETINRHSSNMENQEELKGAEFEKFYKTYISSSISGDDYVVYKLSNVLFCIISLIIDDAYLFIGSLCYVYETKKMWKYIRITND